MADEHVRLSVVLPCYLEEENLRILLPRIRETLAALPMTSEIVLVDTTTPLDETELVGTGFGARVIRRGPSNSFGDAVRSGIASARGELVVFMDADGSHSPELIPRLVAESEDCDIVIASRYIQGGYAETDLLLRLMSRVLNISYSVVLGLDVKDVSNSFKLYRRAVLEGVSLRCQNFDVIEELLVKIKRRTPSVRMREIPCTFKKRMFGETKRSLVLFMFTYLVTILRLRFSK